MLLLCLRQLLFVQRANHEAAHHQSKAHQHDQAHDEKLQRLSQQRVGDLTTAGCAREVP